jgi:hypothetical protein
MKRVRGEGKEKQLHPKKKRSQQRCLTGLAFGGWFLISWKEYLSQIAVNS